MLKNTMESANEHTVLPAKDIFQAAHTNAEKEIEATSEVQPKRKPSVPKTQPKSKPTASEAQPKSQPTAAKAQPKSKPTASEAQPKSIPSASEAKPKRKPTARNLVLGAIRQLKSAKGSSFADIRKYLESKYPSSDVVDLKSLKLFVTTAVDQGILEKDGGKYKIKETGKPTSKSATKRVGKTEPGVKSSSGQRSKKSSRQKEQSKPEKRRRTSLNVSADGKPKESHSEKSEAESVQAE